MVPEVIRLTKAGVCGCGQVVAAGERAGSTSQPGRVVCLACVATFSAHPDETDQQPPGHEVDPQRGDPVGVDLAFPEGSLPLELPEPVAVLIPADWGTGSSSSAPAGQGPAGAGAVLPPAAPLSARVVPAAPVVAVQIALPTPPLSALVLEGPPTAALVETTPPAPVVEATPPALAVVEPRAVVGVSAEAVAMTVPSHRRRTMLPAGLLALRPSRGRQPGSTGQSDATTRALLDHAAPAGVLALHDRRMPGRRSRIAHLAFGPGGVYVIDVVRANNARVEVLPGDDLDSDPRDLLVGGRPMTATVTATLGRVAIVRALLDEVGLSDVPVLGVMYFIDATVPSGPALEVAGIRVVGRTGLPVLVQSEGALDAEHRATLQEYLTERLPAA